MYLIILITTHVSLLGPLNAKTVTVTYIEPSGDEKLVQAEVGKNLLDIAHENDIELEGAS
jgi:hypothetical protein